jgi:hypothetical protein
MPTDNVVAFQPRNSTNFLMAKSAFLRAVAVDRRIPPRQRGSVFKVAWYLSECANRRIFSESGNLEAWPGTLTMADALAMKEETVIDAFRALEAVGYLDVRQGKAGRNTPNRYRLLMGNTPPSGSKYSAKGGQNTPHSGVEPLERNLLRGEPPEGDLPEVNLFRGPHSKRERDLRSASVLIRDPPYPSSEDDLFDDLPEGQIQPTKAKIPPTAATFRAASVFVECSECDWHTDGKDFPASRLDAVMDAIKKFVCEKCGGRTLAGKIDFMFDEKLEHNGSLHEEADKIIEWSNQTRCNPNPHPDDAPPPDEDDEDTEEAHYEDVPW